jgi:hypothetical protein
MLGDPCRQPHVLVLAPAIRLSAKVDVNVSSFADGKQTSFSRALGFHLGNGATQRFGPARALVVTLS